MHGSKLEPTVWFWAAYLMATHSNGISATHVQMQLGLGPYNMARLLCATLRRAIADYSAENIRGFAATNVAAGVKLKTDECADYPGTPGVDHDPHIVGATAAPLVLPWTHRVFANLERWALGVYRGLRRNHLQSDLDEFVFRFNRRRTRHVPSARCSASEPEQNPSPTKC